MVKAWRAGCGDGGSGVWYGGCLSPINALWTPMAEAHQAGRESSVPEYASQYGAEYYHNGFGPEPYERSTPHWLEFFGGMASEIIRSLRPRNVFDAGCAWGFLVEAFWDRGVEARGEDVSEYAIAHLRPDMQSEEHTS